jgi:mannosyltransferase OCH1-like enzyme
MSTLTSNPRRAIELRDQNLQQRARISSNSNGGYYEEHVVHMGGGAIMKKPLKRNAKNAIRNLCNVTLKFLCSLKMVAVLGLLIVSFMVYVHAIHNFNIRSIRDPCMVAQTSKINIQESLSSIERNFNTQTNAHDEATFVSIGMGLLPNSTLITTPKSFEHTIPKIIHQQWKNDNIPHKFTKWRNKFLQYFPEPEYQHMIWTDTKGRELIKDYYPWFLKTYDEYAHNINRADAVRYFVLHHFGGIYADLDYEPTTNFYEYIPPNQVSMVESPYYWNEKTQNCLMSSPKHDPFWVDLFAILIKNAKRTEVLEATGPKLLDEAIEYSVHPTYLLPCENFQRVPLGEYDKTLWTTIFDREVMFRLKPISKHCGYFSNNQCHFGKHHNTVSYRTTSGKVL